MPCRLQHPSLQMPPERSVSAMLPSCMIVGTRAQMNVCPLRKLPSPPPPPAPAPAWDACVAHRLQQRAQAGGGRLLSPRRPAPAPAPAPGKSGWGMATLPHMACMVAIRADCQLLKRMPTRGSLRASSRPTFRIQRRDRRKNQSLLIACDVYMASSSTCLARRGAWGQRACRCALTVPLSGMRVRQAGSAAQ